MCCGWAEEVTNDRSITFILFLHCIMETIVGNLETCITNRVVVSDPEVGGGAGIGGGGGILTFFNAENEHSSTYMRTV